MGVDLTLIPLKHREAKPEVAERIGFTLAQAEIELERRRELWAAIEALPTVDLPAPLQCHRARRPDGEKGYGELTHDPYDSPIRAVSVSDLCDLRHHEAVQSVAANRAAWAYLDELPVDTPVVLLWG